ncbi:MAG TPA: hypothetical protein VFD66_06675 [Verrucomicrobiae bacterium]|nr:hypothetical protein [Verrucomicrobiae bacterium]
MKVRTDLLKHATPAEALKEAMANNHRHKPEPHFSQTGVGSLSSATTRESAQEVARSTARIRKALRQSARNGTKGGK